jgi:hypothetical protein
MMQPALQRTRADQRVALLDSMQQSGWHLTCGYTPCPGASLVARGALQCQWAWLHRNWREAAPAHLSSQLLSNEGGPVHTDAGITGSEQAVCRSERKPAGATSLFTLIRRARAATAATGLRASECFVGQAPWQTHCSNNCNRQDMLHSR